MCGPRRLLTVCIFGVELYLVVSNCIYAKSYAVVIGCRGVNYLLEQQLDDIFENGTLTYKNEVVKCHP